ncbi:PaaD-like zinc ribbon domain-containing protein [Anoxybacteroides rupiense]
MFYIRYLQKHNKKRCLKMDRQEAVYCSFCHSVDVAKMSMFGTAQLVSQYYCHQCKSVFEWVRWRRTLDEVEKNR